MKIYAYPLSAPSRFVMTICKQTGIEFSMEEVDLMSQEQKGEAHLKRNPMGLVPVMEDGDFTLIESCAIVRYLLDTKAPGNTLFPTDPKQRALVNQRIGGLNDLRGAALIVIGGKVVLPRQGKTMPAALLAFGETHFNALLTKINEAIAGKKYVCLD